ncbi:MAG: NAD(P)-binding domain-containing protein [Verrucomicrobiota bacterium]
MIDSLHRYFHWLHGKWPAGTVESLPIVGDDGATNVSGIRIVGDLSGVPLLKFSSETGTRAVRAILAEADFQGGRSNRGEGLVDLAIIGAGVSGVSAAIEAQKAGLTYRLFESSQLFSTVENFPRGKPIYTYPVDMEPSGGIAYGERSGVKEGLLEEMREQVQEHNIEVTPAHVDRVEKQNKGFLLHHGDGSTSRARRVIIAIGRSGNFRTLGVPGEESDKVANRLYDPAEYREQNVLIVGGGDSAMEAAIALAGSGANVTVSYRGKALSRPKPENVEQVEDLAATGKISLKLETSVTSIEEGKVVLVGASRGEETVENDSVLVLIGREAPLDFFRRSGIAIAGERNRTWWLTLGLALFIATFIYHWKKSGTWLPINETFVANQWFPFPLAESWAKAFPDITGFFGMMRLSVNDPGFYYSLLYCALMVVFGIRRIKKRNTPYVTRQTQVLLAIQIIPLFLLPYLILPWMGHAGLFGNQVVASPVGEETLQEWKNLKSAFEEEAASQNKAGEEAATILARSRRFIDSAKGSFSVYLPDSTADWGEPVWAPHWTGVQASWSNPYRSYTVNLKEGVAYLRDDSQSSWPLSLQLFPPSEYGHGREYWRAFGLILAWPLFIWNVFTDQPLWGWLIISLLQTCVIIPLIVWRWGKGAYCGWICSCGGMAETFGDEHRHKMPHGPIANRLNMIGQGFLVLVVFLLLVRLVTWMIPGTGGAFAGLLNGGGRAMPWSYVWFVDLLFAGIIGFGVYFHFSGRVWCRFACPLAALMHLYARFSQFRIFAEKKKCISCNVCTSVCHQGIDVMNFANKGEPMADPECVRCSACVQQCPTGVLSFGRYDAEGKIVYDQLRASSVDEDS